MKIAGEELFDESEWDEFTHTYRITHENDPDGVAVVTHIKSGNRALRHKQSDFVFLFAP